MNEWESTYNDPNLINHILITHWKTRPYDEEDRLTIIHHLSLRFPPPKDFIHQDIVCHKCGDNHWVIRSPRTRIYQCLRCRYVQFLDMPKLEYSIVQAIVDSLRDESNTFYIGEDSVVIHSGKETFVHPIPVTVEESLEMVKKICVSLGLKGLNAK